MAYTKQTWADGSSGNTPITAARLQHVEDGLAAVGVVADRSDTRVFDARAYGVIADGAQHNNVANLLDCFAQAYTAGAQEVLLPAGVIDTSEATVNTTVTADSGRTYTNNGGISLPVNQPITITGHGAGITIIKQSPGFLRGFDFWYLVDGQNYKQIVIRGITFDRNNITGVTVAPSTAVTGAVTLTHGSVWTTLPGISTTTFKNARYVYFPKTNVGTANGVAMLARISAGNYQVRNDSASTDYTLSTGDLVRGAVRDHVITGTMIAAPAGNGYNMTIDQVTIENCHAINVGFTAGATVSELCPDTAEGISLYMQQNPSNPVVVPSITNFTVRNVRVLGGSGGIHLSGSSPAFLNEIWFYDCFHDTMLDVPNNYACVNFMIGGSAWVNRCGVIRCTGRRSGDVALELDQPWEAHEEDCLWEDAFSGIYRSTFVPPARSIAGPPTVVLSGAITNVATSLTIGALPVDTARVGMLMIDTELMWYRSNAAGTTLNLTRGFNGSTPASHADAAKITFVQTEKTRIYSVRPTITGKVATTLGGGRCYLAFENSSLPLPPITIRDAKADLLNGVLIQGQFCYWQGWQPDIDIQGTRYTQDSLNHITPNGSAGSLVGWNWPAGSGMFTAGSPVIPHPRIYGRNNNFRLHGSVTTTGVAIAGMRVGSGYALLDFDLSVEFGVSSSVPASLRAMEINPSSGTFVVAPQSRVGIKVRTPWSFSQDAAPRCLYVAASSAVTIPVLLDVDLDAYELLFSAGSSDSNYGIANIDSTQTGKVRMGRIRHAANVAANYPSTKRFAVAVSASPYAVGQDEEIVMVTTTSTAITVTLPNTVGGAGGATSGEPLTRGRVLTIVDASGNAATNNITITPAGTDKILSGGTLGSAGSSVTISTAGGKLSLLANPAIPGWISI